MLREIVAPERLLLSQEVEEVIAPGELGQFGVLPGHRPFFVALGIGELIYRADGEEYHVALGGGFAEVLPDRVTVLADWAELPEEIDLEKARTQKEEAEARLKELVPMDPEYDLTLRKLQEALLRLQVRGQSETSRTPR
ncbi:MAG: F0F1 ATP synthase subunit epsilon [Deltaproteobacteria bacterium]|nr:MAG: F0F1 ATP synthase subunit epsilon [Deltaproteobacteria bacterium]